MYSEHKQEYSPSQNTADSGNGENQRHIIGQL